METEKHVLRIQRGSDRALTEFDCVGGIVPETVTFSGKRYKVIEDVGIVGKRMKKKKPDREHMDFKCMGVRRVISCERCLRYQDCLADWEESHGEEA